MILSASRRTDIPNYYSEWFYNRIGDGFFYVRNPMNYRQVSEIKISPDVVDCIVFWTKNPEPMLDGLGALEGYDYYFQFTLTGYGKDVEPGLPHKQRALIPIFQKLSDMIGPERTVWRYDPIFFSERYTPQYHIKAFGSIAGGLCGYTEKCVISFLDFFPKIKKNMERLSGYLPDEGALKGFAGELSGIARDNGIAIESCAEKIDLAECGIAHGSCIDKALIERIAGRELNARRDKNQREACGCIESIDVGTYDTCQNGCAYCYANRGAKSLERNLARYDPASPLLCGRIEPEDRISARHAVPL